MNSFDIIIIGGGASGLIAYCQAKQQMPNKKILVFEPNTKGAGLAYATEDPSLILNVPAPNMSIYPTEPNHFIHWLKKKAPEALSSKHYPFVSRCIYRQYLEDCADTFSDKKDWIRGQIKQTNLS